MYRCYESRSSRPGKNHNGTSALDTAYFPINPAHRSPPSNFQQSTVEAKNWAGCAIVSSSSSPLPIPVDGRGVQIESEGNRPGARHAWMRNCRAASALVFYDRTPHSFFLPFVCAAGFPSTTGRPAREEAEDVLVCASQYPPLGRKMVGCCKRDWPGRRLAIAA